MPQTPEKVLVEYKGLNIYRAAGLRFIPGINPVDAAAWAKAQELPLVRHRINEGILVEQTGGTTTPAGDHVDPTETLEGFNAKEAIAKVEATIDGELLAAWQATETRKSVAEAIEKRLAAIDPAKKPEGEDAK